MTINDVLTAADLPERLRVHALAKLLGRTSREVITALGGLGVEVRSAQSSIDRTSAEQVSAALAGTAPAVGDAGTGPGGDLAGPEPDADIELTPPVEEAPRAVRAPRAARAPRSAKAPRIAAGPAPEPIAAAIDDAASDRGAPVTGDAAPSEPVPVGTGPAAGPSTGTDTAAGTDPEADTDTAADLDAAAPTGRGRSRTRRSAGTGRARRAAGPVDPAPDSDPPAAEAPVGDVGIATPDARDDRAGAAFAEVTDLADLPGLQDVSDILDLAAPAPPRRSRRMPAAPLSPVFAPPAPLFQAPERPPVARRTAEPAADEPVEDAPAPRRRRRSRTGEDAPAAAEETYAGQVPFGDPEQPVELLRGPDPEPVTDEVGEALSDDDLDADGPEDDESSDSARRRRRRGRRGRGRGRGGDEEDAALSTAENDTGSVVPGAAEPADLEAQDDGESEEEESDDDPDSSTSRRRRRRRRRRGAGDGDGDEPARTDDPPGTVVRIRPPREAREDDGDGVQGVRGSTRLEAKRQRRRDGRDAGRRRPPLLSEAEFLARRESVERTMVVRERRDRVEIGVLEDDILVEHFITDAGHDGAGKSLVGNIYLGRVQNVLPSMEAAFVDIGRGRNAVLYAGEVDWDAAGLGGKARRIEQAMHSGDPVLVQVTKDPLGHKGARLTTQISLAGRFLVYVPSGGAAGISRKLPDIERKRLKDMLKELVPSEAGVIIRTASEGVSHEALERDVRRLQAQWEVVQERSEKMGREKPKAPVLLYEEPDLLIKVVRDLFNEDFSRLVVEGDDAFDTLHGYISHVAPELAARMHRHVGTEDVFTAHRIDEQLLKALDRKVWLPSGGTLVIDRTEAMTVIDVNTGKFTGSGGNLEETVTRNNLEAAEEIVHQMRLRDIGGIIVVDFIDMVLEANRDLLLRRLTECLARDRTRHQVAEVTSLGLVQMTRKRVGGGLIEHFSHPCEHCRGRGVVIDVPDEAEELRERVAEPRAADNGGGRRSRGGRGRRGEADDNGSLVEPDVDVDDAGDVRPGRAGRNGHDAEIGTGNGHAADGIALVRNGRGGRPGSVAAEPVVPQTSGPEPSGAEPSGPEPSGAEPGDPQPEFGQSMLVESAVAEPAVGAELDGAGGSTASGSAALDGVDPEPAPRARRRGRVTRTAGAPSAPAGTGADGAPATAILTLDATRSDPDPSTEPVPAMTTEVDASAAAEASGPDAALEPVPVPTARPRRPRRSASRPAGPPVDGGGAPS